MLAELHLDALALGARSLEPHLAAVELEAVLEQHDLGLAAEEHAGAVAGAHERPRPLAVAMRAPMASGVPERAFSVALASVTLTSPAARSRRAPMARAGAAGPGRCRTTHTTIPATRMAAALASIQARFFFGCGGRAAMAGVSGTSFDMALPLDRQSYARQGVRDLPERE